MPHRLNSLASQPVRTESPCAGEPLATALSIIVVNFRRPGDVMQLIEQLDRSEASRGGQAEIVVVDNDDDPKPLRRWAAQRPEIQLRSLGCNRGFARAVNEGCRLARGEWILLLNPDIEVPEEFADEVLTAADRIVTTDPNVGVIGFELRHGDGTPQPSAGPFPTLLNVATGLVRSRQSRRCRTRKGDPASVPWVTGCCLLVRRSCWLELGGFDEDFFLYYEDVDLCRRARAIGWTVWYEPGLRVTHFHPLHQRDVVPPLRLITRYALLTYAAKHWPRWQTRLLGRCIRAEARFRRRWAEWRQQPDDARHFQSIDQLTCDLVQGRSIRARATVLAAARKLAADSPS